MVFVLKFFITLLWLSWSFLWCMVGFVIWHAAIPLVVTVHYVHVQAPGVLDSSRSIRNNRRVQPIKPNQNQFMHAQSKTLTMNQSTYTYTTVLLLFLKNSKSKNQNTVSRWGMGLVSFRRFPISSRVMWAMVSILGLFNRIRTQNSVSWLEYY